MKYSFLVLLFGLILWTGCSDDDPVELVPEMEEEMDNEAKVEVCGVDRYLENTYENVNVTTVKFGENTNVDGSNKELFMDVYIPDGDTTSNRAVVVWAFGGAFITGDRKSMKGYATNLAEKGYVSVSIDYRILSLGGGVPSSEQGLDIAIKAMGDMKAAIRFLRASADNGNPYGIDPNKIIAGGVSAGAIVAIQTAMVDEEEIIDDSVRAIVNSNGGIEGSSGDEEFLSYSSDVQGVISLSGAIYDKTWVDANDPPILSYHGDSDQTVKYGEGFAMVFNIPIVNLFGSSEIHAQAEEVGLQNQLITVPGGDHEDVYVSDRFESYQEMLATESTSFLIGLVCK